MVQPIDPPVLEAELLERRLVVDGHARAPHRTKNKSQKKGLGWVAAPAGASGESKSRRRLVRVEAERRKKRYMDGWAGGRVLEV